MSESKDLAGQVKTARAIARDLVRLAERLKRKADELEKRGDRLKAMTARGLVVYLLEAAEYIEAE
jgi:hypothetical protein